MSGGAEVINLTAFSPHKRVKLSGDVLQEQCSSQGSEDVVIIERPPSFTKVRSAAARRRASNDEDDDVIITGANVTVSGDKGSISIINNAAATMCLRFACAASPADSACFDAAR